MRTTLLWWVGVTLFFLIAGALLVILLPVGALRTDPPLPSLISFEDAVARVDNLDSQEQEVIREECESTLLHHGRPTERVYVLLHGYTNCPRQFLSIGQTLHSAGHTVLIPRLPGHGHRDTMTEALAAVDVDDFERTLARSMVIAEQLGAHRTVVGLSGGGTLALWAALYESRADRVITISPVAYPTAFAPWLRSAMIRYMDLFPNRFIWWDKERKDQRPAPEVAYHRFATGSMGALLHMAARVEYALREGYHRAIPITFVINDGDPALRSDRLTMLSTLFRSPNLRGESGEVEILRFTSDKELPHDLIDPESIKEKQDIIYPPLLTELLRLP